jgi:hypothetical protein
VIDELMKITGFPYLQETIKSTIDQVSQILEFVIAHRVFSLASKFYRKG